MLIFIAVLSFFGWTLQASCLIKRSFDVSVIFLASILIIALYILGLLGILNLGAKILLILGVLLFFSVHLRYKQFLSEVIYKKPYGLIFFLISISILALASSTRSFSNFSTVDDFSHWARVSKLLVEYQRLLTVSDPLLFHNYPPGTALFHYFFLQLGAFSASGAMFAQGILILSAFTRIFSVIQKEISFFIFLLVSLFILIYSHFFGTSFRTLTVDMVVGLFFGVGLLGYLSDRKSHDVRTSLLTILPIIIVLPLIKLTGILFSLVIVAVAATEAFFSNYSFKNRLKYFIYFSFAVAAIFSSYLSWNAHIKNSHLPSTFSTDLSLAKIVSAFDSKKSSAREQETISAFSRAILTPYKNKSYTPYYWLLVTIFLVFLYYSFSSKIKPTRLGPFVVIFLGFVGYLSVLLILYLFSFSAYEGPRLASMGRYLSSYFFGALFLLFGLILQFFLLIEQSKKVTRLFILGFFLIIAPEIRKTYKSAAEFLVPRVGYIEYTTNYANFVVKQTNNSSNIYFLMQGSNGTENTIFNYGVLPRGSNQSCSSVGEKYFDGDVWTCNKDINDFSNSLKNYDYLFIAYVDKQFNDIYSSLFLNVLHNGALYKISKNEMNLKFEFVSEYKGEIFVPNIFKASSRKIKLLDKIDEKLKNFRTKIYRFEGDIETNLFD